MKTVCIVGSHPDTRALAPFDDLSQEIWVFNEAAKADWCKRVDAVFQLHKPVIWRSKANRNDPKHYEWLKNADCKIYMQDHYSDVPSSVKYPLDEVLKIADIRYLTSSVAYALALAIYQGYDVIKIYGVEMESNTEYAHQRPGVALWLGVAVGRGIKVEFATNKFFAEPLYGYEGTDTIPVEMYKKRIDEITPKAKELDANFKTKLAEVDHILTGWVDNFKSGYKELDQAIMALSQAAHDFGAYDGALQQVERYYKKCQTMLAESGECLIMRQEYEGNSAGARKAREGAIGNYNMAAVKLEEALKPFEWATSKDRRKVLVHDFKKCLAEYVKRAVDIGITEGVMMENDLIMITHDKVTRAL